MKKLMLAVMICMVAVMASAKKPLDQKYGIGAVPVDGNGKVTFTQDIKIPAGMSDDAAYNCALTWAKGYFSLGKSQKAKLLSDNPENRSFSLSVEQMLIFKSTGFISDETVIGYTVSGQISGGVCKLKITDIRYRYEEKRESGGQAFTAEEWITDDEAFNKKKTKLYKQTAKFRIKTIDLKDQIFEKLTESLNR